MKPCIICKKNKIPNKNQNKPHDVNRICKSCYNIDEFCIKCTVNLSRENSSFCDRCGYLFINNIYTCTHCKNFECYAKDKDPIYKCHFNCPKTYIEFERNYDKIKSIIVNNIRESAKLSSKNKCLI